MKMNKIFCVCMGIGSGFSLSVFANVQTSNQSSEAIYQALNTEEAEISAPASAVRVTQKSMGGLLCQQRQELTSAAHATYHCVLAADHNAAKIYFHLSVPEQALAPGYCGPSSYTKTVGKLSCDRTLGDEIGRGYVYFCDLDMHEYAF